jgi:hypothetical protein
MNLLLYRGKIIIRNDRAQILLNGRIVGMRRNLFLLYLQYRVGNFFAHLAIHIRNILIVAVFPVRILAKAFICVDWPPWLLC